LLIEALHSCCRSLFEATGSFQDDIASPLDLTELRSENIINMSPARFALAALSLFGSMQSAEAMGINCDGSSFCRMGCENFTVSRIHRLVSEGIGNGYGGQTYWQNGK